MLALTPNLQNLALVLRHREMWPEGFEWDYRECTMCAMGLAWSLGMLLSPNTAEAEETFNISDDAAHQLFIYVGRKADVSMADVTPEHVADAIGAYLAEQRAAAEAEVV